MKPQILYDEFRRRYGKREEEIRIFCAACPLPLLGKGMFAAHHPLLGIGITPASMLAIRPRADRIFRIQETDSNEEGMCLREQLSNYRGKRRFREIFALCDRLCGQISGAELLFFEEKEIPSFHQADTACALALGAMTGNTEPKRLLHALLPNRADGEENRRKLCSLSAREGRVMLISDTGVSHLPFLNEDRLILVFSPEEAEKNSLPEAFDQRREVERIQCGIRLLSVGGDIWRLTEEAAEEWLKCGGDRVGLSLWNTAKEWSNGCAAGERGLVFSVREKCVDRFLEEVHQAVKKKTGSPPAFLICKTVTSGEVSDVETE